VAEQHAALRDAFARLPPGCQQLLALLIADPPVPYAEISARLGISVGSIGPSRRRCLDRLGRDPGNRCPDQHRSREHGGLRYMADQCCGNETGRQAPGCGGGP
jgi:DNA-directed RNA polymerase specialized sigma24 family protein